MEFIILLGLLNLASSYVTINLGMMCVCSDYKLQTNCPNSCVWSDSVCRARTCSDYAESDCKALSTLCKWDSTCIDYNCASFTKEETCQNISAT